LSVEEVRLPVKLKDGIGKSKDGLEADGGWRMVEGGRWKVGR